MPTSRRRFLHQSAALAALAGARPARRRARVRVGSFSLGFDQAKAAGLDGIELPAGPPAARLAIADPDAIAAHLDAAARTGVEVPSLMMSLLNECPLATDPRAPKWLDQAIDAAHQLGARVVLLAFFGNGDLLDDQGRLKQADVDAVVRILKDAAPRAAAKGVVLGIENYLDAAANLAILDAVGHPSVQVYYDVYNTGITKGHDVPADLRKLGPRVAQVHVKNGPDYLDKGNIDFPAIARALDDIGYDGWVVLETSSPSGDAVADARRNAEFVRGLFRP
jgi:sugar phosphate isomerase/epimerase